MSDKTPLRLPKDPHGHSMAEHATDIGLWLTALVRNVCKRDSVGRGKDRRDVEPLHSMQANDIGMLLIAPISSVSSPSPNWGGLVERTRACLRISSSDPSKRSWSSEVASRIAFRIESTSSGKEGGASASKEGRGWCLATRRSWRTVVDVLIIEASSRILGEGIFEMFEKLYGYFRWENVFRCLQRYRRTTNSRSQDHHDLIVQYGLSAV